tara:strand:+ start:68 stop:1561 length:1494 start_codon:yes stop_codon:yes gene_type:complete
MASEKEDDEPMKEVDVDGTVYAPLADGKYDIIILGTGLTECVVGGLLAVQGKKVLQLDRNNYYGSEAASLNITDLFKKFEASMETKVSPDEIAALGANRDYQVDLIPKFLMASGKMVKMLLHAQVTHYLDFKLIDGSFVFKGNGAGKPTTLHKVPSSGAEALKTDLVGFFQKRRLKNLFMYLAKAYDTGNAAAAEATMKEIKSMTARELYALHKCDDATTDFCEHAMALHDSAEALDGPAFATADAIHLYGDSVMKHGGGSPYLYPQWGLSSLPEAFSRKCAVNGGTYMLNQDIDELLLDASGKCIGVKATDAESGVEMAALAPIILGEPSYFPDAKLRKTGQVVRCICLLDHPIAKAPAGNEAAQIIIPANQVAAAGFPSRAHDIYVTVVGSAHKVAPARPRKIYIAIVSTQVETEDPYSECVPGLSLLQPCLHTFHNVCDTFEPVADGSEDACFISKSYDGTSHFESVAEDVHSLYERLTGETFDVEGPPPDPLR